MHVMSGEAGKGRAMVPSYSPHTLHRQSPASPAVLHTVCSSSPRPQPHSSSCSPDGPPGAWKQSQGYTDLTGPGTTSFSLIIWLMVLTFFESQTLEYLIMTTGPLPRKRHIHSDIFSEHHGTPPTSPKPIYSTNFRLRTLSSLFSCHLLHKLSSEAQICLSNCLYDVFTWVSNLCFQLNSSSWLFFILIPSKPAPILRKWHHYLLTCLNQKPRGSS